MYGDPNFLVSFQLTGICGYNKDGHGTCHRVQIFREFVRGDKQLKRMGGEAVGPGPGTIEIAVRRDHIVEDGFAQLNGLGSKLKCCINVSFVNELGLAEAGLDYGGLFKEFLTDLATAAFDPG